MSTKQCSVSFLGLGLMGSALAERLLVAGHRVTVWNRTPEKTAALAAKGADVAGTVTDALAASELVIICVTDHTVTHEMLHGASPPGGARTLVQLSSTTPEESRELADRAGRLGMGYLDGSILGLPTTVLEGAATIIYSGPAELFDANRNVLRAMGAPLHLSPEIGGAPVFDRVWYAYAYGVLLSFLQGAAMVDRLGFSLEVYNDVVKARTPVMLNQMMARGEKIRARDYKTADASIETWAKGFEGTMALCREKGIGNRLPAAVMANLRGAADAGHGGDDIAAVFETLVAR